MEMLKTDDLQHPHGVGDIFDAQSYPFGLERPAVVTKTDTTVRNKRQEWRVHLAHANLELIETHADGTSTYVCVGAFADRPIGWFDISVQMRADANSKLVPTVLATDGKTRGKVYQLNRTARVAAGTVTLLTST